MFKPVFINPYKEHTKKQKIRIYESIFGKGSYKKTLKSWKKKDKKL